ncbi:MAG: cation diffusion facilitator family transporter [Candidatus Hodarchaeales archaeon]|jgi:cobalt-zinc-cadmium efflux system protein
MDNHISKNAFSEHLLEYRTVEKKRLLISFLITSLVMVLEVLGGLLTNSIALISDAGHMFTHSFAIAISLIAVYIARRPVCHHKTFGLFRAEILAAFINGLFLLLVVITLVYEAIMRIINPVDVMAAEMLVIAIIGLLVNTFSIFLLLGSRKSDLNLQGLFYHILGDTASSIGIVIAAVVIYFSRWTIIDPLVSLLISIIILIWAIGILRDSTRILLEMTPKGLTIDIIEDDIKQKFPDVKAIYNTHLWTVTSEMLVFSCHIRLSQLISTSQQDDLVSRVNNYLHTKYQIVESTIQVQFSEIDQYCEDE